MQRIYYMHLLDGEPATFDGTQIVVPDDDEPVRLAVTLQEIEDQQNACAQHRATHYLAAIPRIYGCQPVELPDT